jgi:hypothetical protein
MKKLILSLALITPLSLTACQTNQDWVTAGSNILNSTLGQQAVSTALSSSEMTAGLREALSVGTNIVVNQLGQSGGFLNDSNIQIPLPSQLQKVDEALTAIGFGALTNDLKTRMNTAAEIATPKAKALFLDAISTMTIADAQDILFGADNAATSYLQSRMGSALGMEIEPIVQNALNQAGAVQAYDRAIGQYQNLPFMPDIKADLTNHVVDKALDGIFYYVAVEEAAIRNNPAKRTTELLQKVFSQ